MATLPKIIVSLTTSPTRLPLLRETLDSVLQQVPYVQKVLVNLPAVFKRTGETYVEPRTIYGDNELIVWNCGIDDVGPLTKLQGALDYVDEQEDTWILTVDDDIRYLPYTGEMYSMCVQRFKTTKNAYGMCGFNLPGVIARIGNMSAHVLEGFGGVCYHRSQFPNKSWTSYKNVILKDRSCFCSDDLIISNWLALTGVFRLAISNPFVNRTIFWSKKCVLDHGNAADALHNGGGSGHTADTNVARYIKAKAYLVSKRLWAQEFASVDP